MPLLIEALTDTHLDATAELLAARERARAEREPETPHRFDDPAVARQALDTLRRVEGADGAVALRDGRVAGFMMGARQRPPPTEDTALFLRPRSIVIDEMGYAAVPDGAVELYRALYAALAVGWVRDGYFAHFVNVVIAAADELEAWLSLGFSREMVRGLRDIGPVAHAGDPIRVRIDQAGSEDLDIVTGLVIANLRYHAAPPIFQTYFPETELHTRQEEREFLAGPANSVWLAYRDGRAAGLMTFRPWGSDRPGVLLPTVHLRHGFTSEEARGTGIGAALLDRAMAWARDQGFARCTVNWFAANVLGARFWQQQGFRPFGYRLLRQIDDRIAWAH